MNAKVASCMGFIDYEPADDYDIEMLLDEESLEI